MFTNTKRAPMTATERKRAWRLRHPERSRDAERQRAALRRRHGAVLAFTPGAPPVLFSYPSGESYQRYESGDRSRAQSIDRWLRGVGRGPSRHREYMKRLRDRIAQFDALEQL